LKNCLSHSIFSHFYCAINFLCEWICNEKYDLYIAKPKSFTFKRVQWNSWKFSPFLFPCRRYIIFLRVSPNRFDLLKTLYFYFKFKSRHMKYPCAWNINCISWYKFKLSVDLSLHSFMVILAGQIHSLRKSKQRNENIQNLWY
jgi:hypothetical protein